MLTGADCFQRLRAPCVTQGRDKRMIMMPCERDPTTLRYPVPCLKANLTRPPMFSLRRVGRALCTEGCFVIVRVSQRRARRAFSSPQAVFSCLYLVCVRSSDVFNHTS